MAHNVRLSDEVWDAYADLALVIGLPNVASAIAFTAKQALPALKTRFSPVSDSGIYHAPASNSPQLVSSTPLDAAVGSPTDTSSGTQRQNVSSEPQAAAESFDLISLIRES